MMKKLNRKECLILLVKCVEADLLEFSEIKGGSVRVYREKGANGSPEGWYWENILDVARELIDDTYGQRTLTKALNDKKNL